MCSYSHDELPVLSQCGENLSWMERLIVFCCAFVILNVFLLTLPTERRNPTENNKVCNMTLMKEMRKRKHGPSAHLCRVERKEGREKGGRVNTLCVCVYALSCVCLSLARSVCVCVCGGGYLHACLHESEQLRWRPIVRASCEH